MVSLPSLLRPRWLLLAAALAIVVAANPNVDASNNNILPRVLAKRSVNFTPSWGKRSHAMDMETSAAQWQRAAAAAMAYGGRGKWAWKAAVKLEQITKLVEGRRNLSKI